MRAYLMNNALKVISRELSNNFITSFLKRHTWVNNFLDGEINLQLRKALKHIVKEQHMRMYSKSVFPTCLLPKKQYALFHMTKIASCPKIQQQRKNKEQRTSSECKFDAAHLRNSSTEGCGKAAPGKANNAVLSNERICMNEHEQRNTSHPHTSRHCF